LLLGRHRPAPQRSHVAVLDDRGSELLSRRIVNDPQTFLELLAEIDGESKSALEATYGWEWLADVLQDAALRAAHGASAVAHDVAEPPALRRGRQTDRRGGPRVNLTGAR
jgi:hypothetical protein